MKMIATPAPVPANQYANYVHNCKRDPAVELPFAAPLPSVADLQLYVDFGDSAPGGVEIDIIDICTGAIEQIFYDAFVVGMTPEGNHYGVFKKFTAPSFPVTSFAVWLSIDGGTGTWFSELFEVDPCAALMKIKSCHPENATTTGFDVNGIYYGMPVNGDFLGTSSVRYFHIAWLRQAKVRELSNKAVFKSSMTKNFRTTIEKIYQVESAFVAKWYKDVLLAVYSRGVISVDEGKKYIVSDLAFEALNENDLTWKPFAQLKETFRLFYGCDESLCGDCCSPSGVVATLTQDGGDSSNVQSLEPPNECCSPEVISAVLVQDGGNSGDESGPSGGGESSGELLGLRLGFDDIANVPVADPNSVSDWNTFFDTGGYADSPFTSVVVDGDDVILYGHSNLIIKPELFYSEFDPNDHLISIIDESLEVVGSEFLSFGNCIALTNVELPVMEYTGNGTFQSCIALVEIHLPGLTAMGINSFNFCTSLNVLDFPQITEITYGSFSGCSSITEVNHTQFPLLTKMSGNVCFSSCTALVTVDLVNVTDIRTPGTGAGMFLACPNLVNVNLPNIVGVGSGAFQNCTSLVTLSLPLITAMDNSAMSGCTALTTFYVPLLTALGNSFGNDGVFFGITGNIMTITIAAAANGDGDLTYVQANNTVILILI